MLDKSVVCEAPIVTMVVLHLNVEASGVPFEALLCVDSLFGRDFGHIVYVLQVGVVVHKYSIVLVSFLGESSLHVHYV